MARSADWQFVTDISEQPIGSETSVANCQSTPRNISEEGNSRLHHSGSLKSCTIYIFFWHIWRDTNLWRLTGKQLMRINVSSFIYITYIRTYVRLDRYVSKRMHVGLCAGVYLYEGPWNRDRGNLQGSVLIYQNVQRYNTNMRTSHLTQFRLVCKIWFG